MFMSSEYENPQKVIHVHLTSALKTLRDIYPAKIMAKPQAEAVDATQCGNLISLEGHRPEWKRLYLDGSAIKTLTGLQEGLETIYAGECKYLSYPVYLPASCQIADFSETALKGLAKPFLNEKKEWSALPMTEGLKHLSIRGCKDVHNFKGIPQSCTSVNAEEAGITSLEGLGDQIEVLSVRFCGGLKNLEGLPQSCKKLLLSFSGIETLKGLPLGIEQVRVYACLNLKPDALEEVHPSLLPKIEGLNEALAKRAKELYQQHQKTVATKTPPPPALGAHIYS